VVANSRAVFSCELNREFLFSGINMHLLTPIRDVSLFVEVIGHGYPLLLMHGGPGADHWSLVAFRKCADQFTLVFYDHRCNGRSKGAPVSSMTFENLTADADALRQLGFQKWAVLGHSFGGHVALEYALRYRDRWSHLVLLDKGWTVMDRLGEIKVPTLVMAGRDDLLFPPEHQLELAAGIPNARLRIIERAGHNAHDEQPAEVSRAIREFVSADPGDIQAADPSAERARR
jgi:pimeloyl-ACP methyl ester carboxylesterase